MLTVALLLCFQHRMVSREASDALKNLSRRDLVQQESDESHRTFMKAGSLYQNDYMTLWNANGVPISVTLRIQDRNLFELRVDQLNSKDSGSEGWISVTGSFATEPLDWDDQLLGLVPGSSDDLVFRYDERVLDRPTAFLYRCLLRFGVSGILSATALQVDPAKDAVLVTPKANILKPFWDEAVVLRLTTEDDLWKPHSIKEGY